MELFPVQKDLQAFLLRATASLERADSVMEEIQRVAKNADALITEIRAMLAAVRNTK